jgi:predicted PurR-regulated permease PerM
VLQGFLNSIFSKCADIFITHAHDGSRRTPKELFLNYGTFLFLLIGAVSIWMRMFTWLSFLHALIAFWIVALSLLKILDRRVFYYRYFISDEVLVSVLLMLGFFIAAAMVVLYLGTESYLEGSRAASGISEWVQHNFINDERTRQLWSEQMQNSRAMISEAISGVEDNYNDTMWWPPLKSLVKTYYLDSKADGGNVTAPASIYSRLRIPENMTLVQAVTFAYAKVDSVNLTSVQLTDWTSKGLELSSLALGSVAQLVFFVITFLIAFVSLGVRAVFFISTLFYLLCTKWDPIERFVEDLLPIQLSKRPDVVRSLRKMVEGVFFLPLKMSSIHAMVTMVSFTIVNADYMYLATTMTFFISIVPIMPPYLVCVPWVISIGITSSVVKAIVLFVTQYVAFTVIDDMLYEKSIVAVNSYVSALSVVFGVYVFGFEVNVAACRVAAWALLSNLIMSTPGSHLWTAHCVRRIIRLRRVEPRHPSRSRRSCPCV